jgi:hypothetical protein
MNPYKIKRNMKIFLLFYSVLLFLSSCHGKTGTVVEESISTTDKISIVGDSITSSETSKQFVTSRNIYETQEVYESVYNELNYFEFRMVMLRNGIKNNNFDYLDKEIVNRNKGWLIGNMDIDIPFMELVKTAIHIKNNLSFGNDKIDEYYIETYNYYNPTNPKELTAYEENILLQIKARLYPDEEEVDLELIHEIIPGIWQQDDYMIFDGYSNTLRFSDTRMTIIENEMRDGKRFWRIEGNYKIVNNNIIMEPEYYDYINGGIFIAGYHGINGEFFGEERKRVTLSPNGLISYPIVSLSRVYVENAEFTNRDGRYYYKLIIFIDRPVVYYKIREKW